MPGRSIRKAIYMLRLLIETYRKKSRIRWYITIAETASGKTRDITSISSFYLSKILTTSHSMSSISSATKLETSPTILVLRLHKANAMGKIWVYEVALATRRVLKYFSPK